jgi:hypothetical protein
MRLYSRVGATALDHPTGHYDADPDTGAFEFPDEVSDELHSFHSGGKPMWEDQAERDRRLAAEELERLRDPATLLEAIRKQNELVAAVIAPQVEKTPARRRTAKTAE